MTRPDWAPEEMDISGRTLPGCTTTRWAACTTSRSTGRWRATPRCAEPGDARANRAFLGRAVRWLGGEGVRQFLDVGSGIPTLGNVHEVAQQTDPAVRVMYVDIDPVAVSHGRAILAGNPKAAVMLADARKPDGSSPPPGQRLIDFTKPVAVLLLGVLHFVPDADDPAGIVARLRAAVNPGSYIALSHGSPPPQREEDADAVSSVYQRTSTPLHLRSATEIGGLLDGLEIVEPGVVPVTDWHPEPEDTGTEPRPEVLAVVGRKP